MADDSARLSQLEYGTNVLRPVAAGWDMEEDQCRIGAESQGAGGKRTDTERLALRQSISQEHRDGWGRGV